MSRLYYGDNLEMLRGHVADESVDLIYLDPPFNSSATYNILFRSPSGEESKAQAEAFRDTWTWGPEAEWSYDEVLKSGTETAGILRALRGALGESNMMAYLAMMAARLIDMRRVLKRTGSMYLHCDPTASHYLKVILDAIFGPVNYRSEISWRRTSVHNDAKQGSRQYGNVRDVLFFYTADSEWTWNQQYTPYREQYLDSEYRHVSNSRPYKETDVTAAKPGGDTSYIWRVKRRSDRKERWVPDFDDEYLTPKKGWEYLGVAPYKGRYWAYSQANLRKFWEEGRLLHRETGMPRLMQFADEMPGVPLQNDWQDIRPAPKSEALGYPTQKPLALLRRIIASSSNEGDVVLDPFCGCGTTIHAAERMGRQWIGIDVAHFAILTIEDRLREHCPEAEYDVVGRPRDLASAREMARRDKFQFQWWATSLLGVRTWKNQVQAKKGPDRGVDGYLFFKNGPYGEGVIVISVKGGESVSATMIDELIGTVSRMGANMGVFLCLAEPTREMRARAAAAGFANTVHGRKPKVQICTIEDLLVHGRYPDLPPTFNFESVQELRRARGPARTIAEDEKQLSFLFPVTGGNRKRGRQLQFEERAAETG